jgi:hypothetical protein
MCRLLPVQNVQRDCNSFIKQWKTKKLREQALAKSGNLAVLAREQEQAAAARVSVPASPLSVLSRARGRR